MTSETLNPFRPTRWEHHSDGRPLIWFTETAEELTGDKSAYVYGGRGVGKTSLLKGICWEDLVENQSLKLQKKLSDFRHIGIYVRFPDHISASMSDKDWGKYFPDAPDPLMEYHRFFSLAMELTCAERTLDACHSLRLSQAATYKPNQELEIVDYILDEYATIEALSPARPTTFVGLARMFRSIVRRMNEACGRGTIKKFVELLPPRDPYQFLSQITEQLAKAVLIITESDPKPISFKFCLDDCEALSRVQRKSLNTLVRLSRHPVSWVVSSVGTAHEDSETFIESQPLTDADRRVISLDNRDSTDFRNLCQSVVSLRLLFSLPEGNREDLKPEKISSFFDLNQRLGATDVNELIEQLIRRSHRPLAKAVQRAAERLFLSIAKADKKTAKRFDLATRKLPYYEAYLLLHWKRREEEFKSSFDDSDIENLDSFGTRYSDHVFNAWFRRKQLSALLHLSASLRGGRIPLAGANIIVSLSDGSIRDFLEIMGEIFDQYTSRNGLMHDKATSLERFATTRTRIALKIQTDGIYTASESYLTGITSRAEIDSDIVSRLINGLGSLTSLLQSNPSDPRVFASPERGAFLIDFPSPDDPKQLAENEFVQAAIRQAVLSGYLKPIETVRVKRATQPDQSSKPIAYRLHRRFAPHFKFSYRGAYESVRLHSSEIAALCLKSDEISPYFWAKGIAGIAGKFGDPQILLPFKNESANDF